MGLVHVVEMLDHIIGLCSSPRMWQRRMRPFVSLWPTRGRIRFLSHSDAPISAILYAPSQQKGAVLEKLVQIGSETGVGSDCAGTMQTRKPCIMMNLPHANGRLTQR